MKTHSGGFTAVELLITMIIGSMLLVTAYQLYAFVLNDSADTRMRATASNLAYRFMREASGTVTTSCPATVTTTPAIPATANLPSNATATVTVSCANTGTNVPYVSATVTYTFNGNNKSVAHGTYVTIN